MSRGAPEPGAYRRLFERSGAVQLLLDPRDGGIVEANRAAAEFYGRAPEALRGGALRITDLTALPADDVLQAVELASSVSVHSYGFPHRHASGELRLVEMYSGPLQDGGRTLVHAIVHDVTERVRAEEALRRSEGRLRLFVDHAPAAVAMTDRALRYLAVSRRWLADYAMDADAIVGRPHAEVFPEWPAAWGAVLARCLAGAVEQGEEEAFRRADGRLEWRRWEVRPWRTETGGIGGVVILTELITDRKRAEEQERRLAVEREALARVTTILESISDGFLAVDEAWRFTFVNQAAARVLERPADRLLGRELWAEVPFLAAGDARAALTRAASEGIPVALEARDEARDRWFDVRGYPSGDARSIYFREVTDRKRAQALEAELRRSETMSAMGALVAGVAHEVRNPLFGISSTLDAFRVRTKSHPEYERYHAVLQEQVARLSGLMHDLLEYGKPASTELRPAPLGDLVAHACRQTDALAAEAGVTVALALGSGLPAVPMDRDRLAQVFRNLVDNAIRHAPSGSTVRVEVEAVGPGGVECRVLDRGSGFAEDDLPHVFEPFFSKRRGGTGLGLAIVQRVVEEHGGTVTAENPPGGGACLRVRLPAAEGPRRGA